MSPATHKSYIFRDTEKSGLEEYTVWQYQLPGKESGVRKMGFKEHFPSNRAGIFDSEKCVMSTCVISQVKKPPNHPVDRRMNSDSGTLYTI